MMKKEPKSKIAHSEKKPEIYHYAKCYALSVKLTMEQKYLSAHLENFGQNLALCLIYVNYAFSVK